MVLQESKVDRPVRRVVTPAPGNPLSIAMDDLAESLRRSAVWLHAGWIYVVWRFRRTRIGAFWHTLSLGVFVIVMGVLWGTMLDQDPVQYLRYVGTGLIAWTLIAAFVTDGASILIAGQSTALQMRFPYIGFAFGHVWRSLLLFGHHMVLYVALIVGTLGFPGWQVLLAVPALVLLLANGVWISLLVGMMSLRRRDFVPALASGMQIMMFVTPVFWPKDRLGPDLAYVADLNPLYHMVRILRQPLLGEAVPLVSWLWVAGFLVVGSIVTLWIYGRYRDRFAYWY